MTEMKERFPTEKNYFSLIEMDGKKWLLEVSNRNINKRKENERRQYFLDIYLCICRREIKE